MSALERLCKPHIKYFPIIRNWACGDWQPNMNKNWRCSGGRTPKEAYYNWLATKQKESRRHGKFKRAWAQITNIFD